MQTLIGFSVMASEAVFFVDVHCFAKTLKSISFFLQQRCAFFISVGTH